MIDDSNNNMVACVAGDKDAWARQGGDDWYATWLPVATAVYDHMKEHLP